MWGALILDSLVRPRAAARRVLGLAIAPQAILETAALVTCSGILLGFVALQISPGGLDPVTAAVLGDPLAGALAQLTIMGVIAMLTYRIGRLFGGTGGFWEALRVVVWLNVVMLTIQAAQVIALLVVPPLASLLALVALFWALWAFASFVTELHGFDNPMFVLGGVVLTAIVLFFGLAMVLAMLGLTPREAG